MAGLLLCRNSVCLYVVAIKCNHACRGVVIPVCFCKRFSGLRLNNNPDLSPWKGRQRVARSEGALAKLRVIQKKTRSPCNGRQQLESRQISPDQNRTICSMDILEFLADQPRILLPPVPGLAVPGSVTRSSVKAPRYGRRSGYCRHLRWLGCFCFETQSVLMLLLSNATTRFSAR